MVAKKHKSEDIKLTAIKYYQSNLISQREISEIFDINERTFRKWLESYTQSNSIGRIQKQSLSYKIKQKHVKYVLKLVYENPTWSINMLWSAVKETFDDFDISKGHLSKVIRDNNITRKRTTVRHYPETRYGKKINFKTDLAIFYKLDKKQQLNSSFNSSLQHIIVTIALPDRSFAINNVFE